MMRPRQRYIEADRKTGAMVRQTRYLNDISYAVPMEEGMWGTRVRLNWVVYVLEEWVEGERVIMRLYPSDISHNLQCQPPHYADWEAPRAVVDAEEDLDEKENCKD